MKLTREEALKLHRQMWSDMKNKLGNNPSYESRIFFKEAWCMKHTPCISVLNSCYLCEYTNNLNLNCDACPIAWHGDYCKNEDGVDYRYSPINLILSLPERKEPR